MGHLSSSKLGSAPHAARCLEWEAEARVVFGNTSPEELLPMFCQAYKELAALPETRTASRAIKNAGIQYSKLRRFEEARVAFQTAVRGYEKVGYLKEAKEVRQILLEMEMASRGMIFGEMGTLALVQRKGGKGGWGGFLQILLARLVHDLMPQDREGVQPSRLNTLKGVLVTVDGWKDHIVKCFEMSHDSVIERLLPRIGV